MMHKHIRESNLIEGIDDPTADAVGVAAWEWLKAQPVLTESVVLTLHRIVTAAQRDLPDRHRGAWRTIDVTVGGRVCPPHEDVPGLMSGWLDQWRNPNDKCAPGLFWSEHRREAAQSSHIEFEQIHPFEDGNGRTGRLLWWWVERELGLTPTLIRSATKHTDYYPWFREEQSNG